MKWLHDAALRNVPGASESLQELLERTASGSSPANLELLRLAAEVGIGRAQMILGSRYLADNGDQRHSGLAVKWLGRAALCNEPGALELLQQHLRSAARCDAPGVLGHLRLHIHHHHEHYASGGSPADLETLRIAAEVGVGRAQMILGSRYLVGSGIQRDCGLAAKWLTRALRCNEPGALELLQQHLHRSEFLQGAAAEGMGEAQELLGESYLEGKNVQVNYQTAEQWLESAASQGRPNAMYLLGLINLNGLGRAPDRATALEWFTKAWELGRHRGAAGVLAEKYPDDWHRITIHEK